jgi:phosphoesterase RecJ-like protein
MAHSAPDSIDPIDSLDAAESALLDAIVHAMRSARAAQIIGHVRPDGDCVGSMLAMHDLLEQWGVAHAMAAENLPDAGYGELSGFDLIRERPDPAFRSDLTIYLDCATEERGPEGWRSTAPVINIDHHGGNSRYGQWNWVRPAASSTGEMLVDLLAHAGVALAPPMATALLVALTTDTGSFRFGNTGARQHRVAARLIEAGARADDVARMAYGSLSPEAARLMGHVYQGIVLEADGRLAWSEVTQEDYRRNGGEAAAPENLCDCLRQVRGVQVALLFHELQGGGIRVNFRSDGAHDVSVMAAIWGGGGHRAASGLTLKEGDYATLRDMILRRALEAFY